LSDELHNLYEVTKEIFDHILDMTKHEDEKAGRIILSIAFLATATATIFGAFLKNNIQFVFYGVELISTLFFLFILFVVLGAYFILDAIGPRYEMPSIWGKISEENSNPKQYAPKSLFFFEKVGDEEREKWMSYFDPTKIDEILKKICNDHIYEAHLVSNKIKNKIRSIKIGKLFFIISLILLVFITLLGIIVISGINLNC